MPALPRPLHPGHTQLREPALAQGRALLGRPAPDLRAGRSHQFPDHRPQPPGARLRCQQGERRHLAPPRPGRRDLRRAQRQGVRARRCHDRDWRRERRDQPRRRDGRRAHGMHDGDDGCLHRNRALRSRPHGRDRAHIQFGERRPLPLRARSRSGLRRARDGIDDAARDRALRRRGERSRGRGRRARVAARDRLSPLQGEGAWRRRLRAGRVARHSLGSGLCLRRGGSRSGRGAAAVMARRHPRRGGPRGGSAADRGLRPDPRSLPQPDGEREGGGRRSRPRAAGSVPCAARSRHAACSRQ